MIKVTLQPAGHLTCDLVQSCDKSQVISKEAIECLFKWVMLLNSNPSSTAHASRIKDCGLQVGNTSIFSVDTFPYSFESSSISQDRNGKGRERHLILKKTTPFSKAIFSVLLNA